MRLYWEMWWRPLPELLKQLREYFISLLSKRLSRGQPFLFDGNVLPSVNSLFTLKFTVNHHS